LVTRVAVRQVQEAEVAANATALAAVVSGNVVIIGTDPTAHQGGGSAAIGAQLWKSTIAFALAGSGPGAVISLSCYYDYGGAPTPTSVAVLNGFGTNFLTQQTSCGITSANTVAIVATSPALTGLTNAVLSNWGCSVHEGFTSWPTTFTPLAIATDSTVPAIFTAGDGTKGFPYILARGVTPVAGGILKVCKVAGLGIDVGSPFSFTAGSSSFTVPAGPAPGGTCVVGPTFPVGTGVTVTETVPAGVAVSAITVAPPTQLVGSPNLAGGSVNVTIGTGVTEVTFTDKRTGFIEICKSGAVHGSFAFTVDPGGLGPFAVPVGACSPAIEVPAGSVIIHELPSRGSVMVGCNTIPAGQQGACDTAAQTSTVAVVPGDISTMTIAFVTNRPRIFDGSIGPIEHGHGTLIPGMTLACSPNPAPAGVALTCTAKMSPVEPKSGTPTGTVSFMENATDLGTVKLGADGVAALAIPKLAAGAHAITASYGGDDNFAATGAQFTLMVAQP
jgi:hypothetical protein